MPPIAVEFTASATSVLTAINKMVAGLERLGEAARAAAAATDEAFSAMRASASSLSSVAESAGVAKKQLQGVARASRSIATATDTAAASVEAGMASIGTAADRMAVSVEASTVAAREGITALDTEARSVGVSVAAGADEATAALVRVAESAKAAATAMDEMAVASERSSRRAAAGADALGAKWLGLGPVFDKVKKWGALGLAGIGIASTDLAVHFQTQMTRISTAAGAPIAQVQAMRSQVLQTATSVGVSGTQMAEALYHPVSAGLDLKTSLQAVKYAAMEAQISGASLDDTTYSLSSVMKAFNMSASQAGPTMADLNAIVGEGDMRFQDLNASIKNWAPTAAQMGISVNSMGAGLAYLTDRGNSAEVAATRLTMGISMMTTPSGQAAKMLEGLGVASSDVSASSSAMQEAMKKANITQNQLALDLKKPDGLYVALKDLKDHLKAAGVSGTEADSVLAKVFGGGRSDKAIMSLMQNLDGVKQKFNAISHDSSMDHFQQAWQQTTKTLKFQFEQIKAGAENLGIRIGDALIPQVSKFITLVEKHGAPIAKSLGGMFSGIAAGFTGKANEGKSKGGSAPQMTGWEKLGQQLRHVADDFKSFALDAGKALHGVAQALGPVAAQIGGALVGALQMAGKILADVVGPALKGFADFLDHNKGLVKAFADVVLGGLAAKLMIVGGVKAATGIVNLATSILGFPLKQIEGIRDAFKGLKEAGKGMAAAGRAVKEFATAEKLAAVATTIWEGAQAVLNVVMDAFPIVLIVLAIAALVAAIVWVATKTTWFQTAWSVAWGGIKAAASAAWTLLKTIFDAIVGAAGTVVGWLKAHWPLLLAILTGPIGIAVLLIVKYWRQISDAFTSAYRAVVSTGGQLISWTAGLPGRILSALASLGSRLWSWASNAFWQALSGAASTARSMVSWLGGLPGRILGALGNTGSLLWSAGRNIIQGLIDGVWSMIGSVGNAISGVVSNIKSYLPWSPAKKGPLSGSGAPEIGGRNIARLMAQGITGGTGDVAAAMARLTGSASASLSLNTSGGLGASRPAVAGVGGGGGSTVVHNHYEIKVAGSVATIDGIAREIEASFERRGMRNSATYPGYRGR
nr:phage tail tape measure protein [Streptomyces sp. CBMA152]